jgi:hypothetical protein
MGEARVARSRTSTGLAFTGLAFAATSETIARDQAGAKQLHMRSVLAGKLTSPQQGCTGPEG